MAYTLTIQPGDHKIEMAENETILEAALRAGLILPYSCRGGSCGSCKGRLLQGELIHTEQEQHTLNDEERAQGYTLFCQARPASDVVVQAREIREAGDIEVRTLPCRVARLEKLAHDVMGVWLRLPQDQRLAFLPGQYIEFLLRDNKRRSFSMANAPHEDELLELHIRHVPGGYFTTHVFESMKEKDLMRIRGPFGGFYLRDDERPVIFVAGGTGLAPVKSILSHAFHSGDARQFRLYWGVRARRDLYGDELMRAFASEHDNFEYIPVLSDPQPKDNWQGRTGWVHENVLEDYKTLAGYAVYACGPPQMIDAAKAVFMERGLDEDSFYYDAFEYAEEGS